MVSNMLKWSSPPPKGCPFTYSRAIIGLAFTGRHKEYTGADTWYPCWAEDDAMYTPWTDGNFDGPLCDIREMDCSSDSRHPANKDHAGLSGTGHARILGSDPMHLALENLGIHYASPAPYKGRYPCGSLVHDGVWYYGTYCLDETERGLNWDVLGPFVGFRISKDLGKSWEDCPHTPVKPLFGESGKDGGKVKIGAPHFVDFGRAMRYSPDGKAYLVAHGATRPDAEAAWIAGDQAFLLRVSPTPETMNSADAYEFFAGHDAHGAAIWTRDLAAMRPLIEWEGHVGHATMTYNAPLKKYLLCITDGWPTNRTMNTYILESDTITGPWGLVTFMASFGPQAYFVNIPSRFIDDAGRTMWLCYSANFSKPPDPELADRWDPSPAGSCYALCLQEVSLDVLAPPDRDAPHRQYRSWPNLHEGSSSPRGTKGNVRRMWHAATEDEGQRRGRISTSYIF